MISDTPRHCIGGHRHEKRPLCLNAPPGVVDTAVLMLFMAGLGLLVFGVTMSYFQAASTEAAALMEAASKAPAPE